ncbi:Sorting nexin, cytoplasm-to-vacuole targeting pathway/endosomal sorting [Coemansia sp. Benny D115]|nr:Sorting nexin, cytoplasm-to-vacuole targeting pathway/endosomal sorting [Coemansia sp. Benny D115]
MSYLPGTEPVDLSVGGGSGDGDDGEDSSIAGEFLGGTMTTEFGDYCCGIDRHLHELLDEANEQRRTTEESGGEYQAPHMYHVVHIGEAEKLTENGSTFIAYSISFGDYEVKRRYSEFESLRSCLCRLYPTFIVPPIPEKHSLAQYAVLQKRAKEDQYIIERRKRMLEHFLNHLAEHPILSSEHIVHRFLESGASWTEVLHSPVITGLPKTPLHSSPSRAPGSSVADAGAQQPKIAATNSLACDVPVPSGALAPIRNVEARWMDCELFTSRFTSQFSGMVERAQARVYRRLGELAGDYAELGAALNGFSLLEHGEALAAAVERAGQAVDSSYIEVNQLLAQMEAGVGEPIHEYAQYALIIKQVLRFRLLKNLQLDGVQDALVRQRAKLESLLQADDEAKRLAQALESSTARQATPSSAIADDSGEVDSLLGDAVAPQGFVTPQRANTDASSTHAIVGARSRGPSVSSAMSVGHHGEFAPTLGSQPHHSHRQQQQQQQQKRLRGARSRAGTGTSIGSTVEPSSVNDDIDDPLALFQQEESQLWGGGTRSTLPRLGAGASRSRSRSRSRGPPLARHQEHIGEDDDYEIDADIDADGVAHMAQSEYVGHSASQHLQQQQQQQQGLAASTPALGDMHGGFGGLGDANGAAGTAGESARAYAQTVSTSSASTPAPASFGVRLLRSPKALGDGIMSRLTYALNGMMDVDPEQLRRNQIGRASDRIGVLEEQLEMLSNDLVLINTSTQDNLDRFQKQKVRELKGVMVEMARMHLEWAEKSLEIWQDAKEAVDEV